MRCSNRTCAAITLAALALAASARAGQVTWNFVAETLGQDVFWTSPTATDPDADTYDISFVITKVEVRVVIFTPTWIDVTAQVPPEFLSGAASVQGPAPVESFNGDLVFPPPPTAPAIQATLAIGLDAAGFGYLDLTDVAFGSIGPPYVPFTIALSGVRVTGSITVDAASLCAGDLNCDGAVNFADIDPFVLALSTPGGAGWPDPDCAWLNGDTNGDFDVNFSDIDAFVALIGTTCP